MTKRGKLPRDQNEVSQRKERKVSKVEMKAVRTVSGNDHKPNLQYDLMTNR